MATYTETTINSRTRLGFGWSNTPYRDRADIEPDTEPTSFGTIRQMAEEMRDVARIHSGGAWWAWSLYVRDESGWRRLGRRLSQEIISDYELHDPRNSWGERVAGAWQFTITE